MGKHRKIIDLDVALHGVAAPSIEGIYDTPQQHWRALIQEVGALTRDVDLIKKDTKYGEHVGKLQHLLERCRTRVTELEKSKARMQQKVQYLDSELVGQIGRVKELEAVIDLASRNEAVWTKQIARQYLVIKQLKEEVTVLERSVNDAAANEGELRQANVKLRQDLEQARGGRRQREADLADVIERLENDRDPEPEIDAHEQISQLAEVLIHEFGNFFDRSEGAVDMAIRLLRGFKKS